MRRLGPVLAVALTLATACASDASLQVEASGAGPTAAAPTDQSNDPSTAPTEAPTELPTAGPTELATVEAPPTEAQPTEPPATEDSGAGVDLEAVSGVLDDFGLYQIPDDVEACAIAELEDLPDVAAAIKEDDDAIFADPIARDQIAEALTGCLSGAEFARILADGLSAGGTELGPDVEPCMAVALDDDTVRRDLLAASIEAASRDDGTFPESAYEPLRQIFACFSKVLIDQFVVGLASEFPGADIEAAVDRVCVDGVVGSDDFVDAIIAAAAQGLDFAALPPELSGRILGPLLGCIRFGELIAAEAAGSGVTLSPSSIECLNGAFRAPEIVDAVLQGEEISPDDAATLITDCLTPEELAALRG